MVERCRIQLGEYTVFIIRHFGGPPGAWFFENDVHQRPEEGARWRARGQFV